MNLNVLDGSAVWLVSMAEALSKTNSLVWVLLKAPILTTRLVQSLEVLPNVQVIPHSSSDPHAPELSPRYAAQRLLSLNDEIGADVIITRGFRLAQAIANSKKLLTKAWVYITDLPFPATAATADQLQSLDIIAQGAKRLFAQTEDARSYLEGIVPRAAGKTILLPPMIPDEYILESAPTATGDPTVLRLVYSGKFARDWQTLEMCGLASALDAIGIDARLTMIGDKFQDDRQDPTWAAKMQEAIQADEVDWVGGKSRSEAMAIAKMHDIGLGWRSARLDSSLEVSTKLLEYGAAGIAPIMNRTIAHEELFGEDYPLFIETDSLSSVVETIASSRYKLAAAREHAWNAAKSFSMSLAAERLESAFRRTEMADRNRTNLGDKVKVVLAGHDLKFAGELIELLNGCSNIELRVDKWRTLHLNDEATSLELANWADVVICEWAGPNSVWYSNHKRAGQRLIVRLHAFELRGPWLPNIDLEKVDQVICVSKLYKTLAMDVMSLPEDKVSIIPNAIDIDDLSRPKRPGSEFRLGLVGMVPFLKRPDRAVDVLRHLMLRDDRYSLHIKGRMPWEYAYEWNKLPQREAYLQFFGEIGLDPALACRVSFEPFGADMGNWFRKIGFILSPSTRESFHLAPAEGMASGSIPVFWERPGVAEIFGTEFLASSNYAAATAIHELASNKLRYDAASRQAMSTAATFDVAFCGEKWLALVLGEDIYAN